MLEEEFAFFQGNHKPDEKILGMQCFVDSCRPKIQQISKINVPCQRYKISLKQTFLVKGLGQLMWFYPFHNILADKTYIKYFKFLSILPSEVVRPCIFPSTIIDKYIYIQINTYDMHIYHMHAHKHNICQQFRAETERLILHRFLVSKDLCFDPAKLVNKHQMEFV